jgi:hypothetical protein
MIVALMTLTTVSAEAQGRRPAASRVGGPFGLGLQLGDPSGFVMKYHLDSRVAIDAGLSFAFDRWILLYSDWIWHVPGGFGNQNEFISQLNPYVGAGGLFVVSAKSEAEVRREKYFSDSSSTRIALGVRVPIGVEWRASRIPLGIYIEIAPGLTIIPATNGFVQGGIGGRFYF